MDLKPGVRISGIRPELVLALILIEPVAYKFNTQLTITSISDGKHGANSLHYKGLAVDIRTRNIEAERRKKFTDAVHAAIGDEFDVVLESDHLHVEFDPN